MRAVALPGARYKNFLLVIDEAALLVAFARADEAGVFPGSFVFFVLGKSGK